MALPPLFPLCVDATICALFAWFLLHAGGNVAEVRIPSCRRHMTSIMLVSGKSHCWARMSIHTNFLQGMCRSALPTCLLRWQGSIHSCVCVSLPHIPKI